MARAAGYRHTEEARRHISEALKGRGPKPEDDAKALRLIGKTTTWEFAERMGCSEQTAHGRLNRLVNEGLAERFKGPRGTRGHLYVANVSSGDVQVVARRRRRQTSD